MTRIFRATPQRLDEAELHGAMINNAGRVFMGVAPPDDLVLLVPVPGGFARVQVDCHEFDLMLDNCHEQLVEHAADEDDRRAAMQEVIDAAHTQGEKSESEHAGGVRGEEGGGGVLREHQRGDAEGSGGGASGAAAPATPDPTPAPPAPTPGVEPPTPGAVPETTIAETEQNAAALYEDLKAAAPLPGKARKRG